MLLDNLARRRKFEAIKFRCFKVWHNFAMEHIDTNLNKNYSQSTKHVHWVVMVTTTVYELYVFTFMASETQSQIITKLLYCLGQQHHSIISKRQKRRSGRLAQPILSVRVCVGHDEIEQGPHSTHA
jgi:hypothetical protein